MGDRRFDAAYSKLEEAEDPIALIPGLSDDDLVAALAAASTRQQDPYAANVLATEILNRMHRKSVVLETADEGLLAVDSEGRVTYANPAARALTGASSVASNGSGTDVTHVREFLPHDVEWTETPLGEAAVHGTPGRVSETPFRRRDGTEVPVAYAAAPILRDDDVVGAVVAFRDITERKRTEAVLRERNALVRALMDHSPAVIYVKDVEGRFLDVNARFLELVGATRDEIVGRVDSDVFPEDQAAEYREHDARVREEGRAFEFEEQVLLPDGPHTYVALKFPLRDAQGRVYAVCGIATDITARKTAALEREALLESTRRRAAELDAVFASIPDAIYIGDATGIKKANRLALDMLGFDTLEDLNRKIPELADRLNNRDPVTGERQRTEDEPFVQALNGARAVREVLVRHLRTGEDVIVRSAAAPVVLDGEPIGAVAVNTDVTDVKRQEAELRESRDRLESILESMTDAFFTLDSEWRFTYVNQEAARVLERDRAELVGRVVWDAFPEAAGSRFEAEYRHARREGRSVRFEEYYPPLNVWFEVQAYPGRDGGLSVFFRDVSALHENEARYRALFEHGPALHIVVDDDGRIDSINRAAERVLGRDADAMRGERFDAFLHRDDAERAREHVAHAFRDGDGPVGEWDARIVRSDGGVVWVRLAVRALPPSSRGRVALVHGVDVTAERRSQAALREQRDLYETLIEAQSDLQEGIVLLKGGHVTFVNDALLRLLGFTREEWEAAERDGMSLLDLLQGDEREQLRALYHERSEGGDVPTRYEATLTRRDGERVHVQVAVKRVSDGEPPEFIAITRDVTARHRAEEELRRAKDDLQRRVVERTRELAAANAELEAFGHTVSHDLRAPLRGIEYFSGLLEEEARPNLTEEQREYLARLRGESTRLTALVNDLLDLSRVTGGTLERKTVDVTRVAWDVVQVLRAAHPERHVDVRVEDGLTANADPRLLRVVLENLIGNAWKYTGRADAARVVVGATRRDGDEYLFVQDNGAGFEPAEAHRLFAPFQRLHTATEFEGSGVGLATVARIVARHGGRVFGEGAPGRGATFYVRF